jgi:hypothetical protein
MNANANDSLIAAMLVGALLAISSAAGRGIFTALAAAAKFGPAALAPLFAAGTGERRLRSMVVFSIAFALVAIVLTVPFLPDGGLREFYDRTLGYQAARGSPFSVWGQADLDWLQTAVKVAAVALALGVAFVPRRPTARQVAALGAAVLIALQLPVDHWFYLYVVWFVPFVLVAIFGAYGVTARPERAAAGSTSLARPSPPPPAQRSATGPPVTSRSAPG